MKLEKLETHQFSVGLADPFMELFNNDDEFWVAYTFDGLPTNYYLDQEALESVLDEMVADSRYPVLEYVVQDYTRYEEMPVFQVEAKVSIHPNGKTEDEVYEELWPVTHEMNRLNPEDYEL